jgi:hypothetical protein
MQKFFKTTRENMGIEKMIPQTECKAGIRCDMNNAMQTYLTCTRI